MIQSRQSAEGRRVAVVRQAVSYDEALVARSVRRALELINVDLATWVSPGDRVVLKPNFIRESHQQRPSEWQQIITHGSVIRAVALEAAGALQGRGTITLADAPQTDSDFDKMCELTGIPALRAEITRSFPAISCEVLDLRREAWRTDNGVIVDRWSLPEDPRGYTLVNLGETSMFSGKTGPFYGADYDSSFTARHHSQGKHEYLISRSVMDADVFINLPKMKTHKKVGVTLSLKNLVGINGDKNFLPHFSIGTPDQGGDEFARSDAVSRLQSRVIRAYKALALRSGRAALGIWGPAARRVGIRIFGETSKVVRSGNWHGNDTTWRMLLDLNRILLHFEGNGERRKKPLRYLTIIDGIIAGEGDGPAEADAKPCGVLLAGTNPLATDFIATRLMGFDWRKVASIREAFRTSELPIADFGPEEIEAVPELGERFFFKPHFGWVGHIEDSSSIDD